MKMEIDKDGKVVAAPLRESEYFDCEGDEATREDIDMDDVSLGCKGAAGTSSQPI
jgi:hypothetical protein